MDWIEILLLGFVLIIFVPIGILLSSLAKQGDERKKFIKVKTMADCFSLILMVLIADIAISAYKVIVNNSLAIHINPFGFLVIISIFFIITLIINKKRYGD